MVKFEIRLKNALSVIDEYNGLEPLHHFLSNYYRRHKQMGGRDRRFCSEVVYAYFRLGNSLKTAAVIDKVYVALFLFTTGTYGNIFTEKYEAFSESYNNDFTDKVYAVKLKFKDFEIEHIFPAKEEISKILESTKVVESIFTQPNIFISVAEKDTAKFIDHFVSKDVQFKLFSHTCLGFEPRVKLNDLLDDSFNYEVQDFSSQQTRLYMHPNPDEHWFDCCAASGGKSLLLYSCESSIELTVSDVRASSLENLKNRFAKNAITNYTSIVADASSKISGLKYEMFDGIVADVPCSGSGTWARNPENLSFFNALKIQEYSQLQFAILENVVHYLKPNKPLIYITCSVYAKENEAVVERAITELPLVLKQINYINGFMNNADTMFCAVFEKI